jgi:hypothetical protein
MITSTSYESKTVGQLLGEIEKRQIALPRYQRDVVWPLDKKRRLINSVRNGFPIGSLLLAEIDQVNNGVSQKAWRIIDGLQRTSTFQDYISEPQRYIEKSWVDPDWLVIADEICFRATDLHIDEELLRHAILEFMLLGTADRDRLKLFTIFAAATSCDVQKFVIEKVDEITELSNKLIEAVSKALDIQDKQLSIIKFVGSTEDQATAFEVLNTGSIQLNKYEIAASIWRRPCVVTSEDVRDRIKKYWKDRLENLQLEIDGIADDGTPDSYMLFDVLVGLGRLITEKYPLLFKKDWGDTVGFQIAAVANTLRLSSINSIEDKMPLSVDGIALEADDFISAALGAAQKVDDALSPVLGLKLTARTVKTQFQEHSALQMCSLLCSVMIEALGADRKWKQPIPARTPLEKKALKNWYLIDRLRGEWGNAGDSTLFNRVWKESPSKNGETILVPNSVYKTSPDQRTAELALDTWFEEEMAKAHREREIISSETKMLLRYFYSPRVAFFDNHAETFQIDHLVPIEFWKRVFTATNGDGLAINGIGNLCMMNTEDHSTKGIKLPKQWFESDVSNFNAVRIDRVKNQYFLVEVEEFSYANSAQSLLEANGMNQKALKNVKASFEQQSIGRWKVIRKAILENHFT